MRHRWIPRDLANAYVADRHSHLPPVRSHIFALGAFEQSPAAAILVGVVIVARPIPRSHDDGIHAEVVRLCTDGHPNAASFLLGAARRVAAAMGFESPLRSYTLDGEEATPYRAAGWICTGVVRARSWNSAARADRADVTAHRDKRRWEIAV